MLAEGFCRLLVESVTRSRSENGLWGVLRYDQQVKKDPENKSRGRSLNYLITLTAFCVCFEEDKSLMRVPIKRPARSMCFLAGAVDAAGLEARLGFNGRNHAPLLCWGVRQPSGLISAPLRPSLQTASRDGTAYVLSSGP